MDVTEYYNQALKQRGYSTDSAQRETIDRMQVFYDEFLEFKKQRSNPIRKFLNRPAVPKGLYLWGGVGRGKSFLMDCFYSSVPLQRKTRLHFHEFMRGVHAELAELKGMKNPLDEVAQRVAKRYRLICFDEFHVSDIADAMILYRLLEGLFAQGVTFLMTSNYKPDELYPNGLHRDRLLPAIALLNTNLDVMNVDAGQDYRRKTLEKLNTYLIPLSPENNAQLQADFDSLAETEPEEPVLRIESREIPAVRRAGSVVWFDFQTLCGGPRSQNDYLEIASQFQTVILSNVPQMGAGMASEARRFTWLIDVLYDHRVKLIVSAQVPPEALYTEGAMANEFVRTASRIEEMQSKAYLESPKREAARL
ncbi:MAG: cell division protein ZapE [Limnobacter sp.]|nr:cell division protein ZapE [Limnobacter sp.]